jgi:hypothetical protein
MLPAFFGGRSPDVLKNETSENEVIGRWVLSRTAESSPARMEKQIPPLRGDDRREFHSPWELVVALLRVGLLF